jgi:hypothetical protein
MYAQVFLIAWARGRGFDPITSANFADGVNGFIRAGLIFLFAIFFFLL